MTMRGEKKPPNQYFSLHAGLGFYLFWFCLLGNLNCRSVTKLMTLFCLPQNDGTCKGRDQKSISPKGAPSVPRQGCFHTPPWLCAVGLLVIEPFFLMLDLLRCRRICCCQSCLLYPATALLVLKAEKHQKIFLSYWAKFTPDVMMLCDYAEDNFQAFVF